MSGFILPKVDGHVHANGMTTNQDVVRLATKYGVTLPLFYTINETVTLKEHEAYYGIRADGARIWRDHHSFHKVYDETVKMVRTPEDLKEIVKAHLVRAAAEGCLLTEVLTSGFNNHKGIGDPYPNFQNYILHITHAIQEAREEAKTEAFISLTAKRHVRGQGIEAAMQLLDCFEIFQQEHPDAAALVSGFNLAGDENAIDCGIFAPVFKRAARLGLFCSSHAGEVRPKDDVRTAIEQLGVKRVGHGLSAVGDPEALCKWATEGVAFEQLLTSNELMYPGRFIQHPIRELIDSRIPVVLGTDDPGIFSCTIGGEYLKAASVYGLTPAELMQCTINGINHSSAPANVKEALLERVIAQTQTRETPNDPRMIVAIWLAIAVPALPAISNVTNATHAEAERIQHVQHMLSTGAELLSRDTKTVFLRRGEVLSPAAFRAGPGLPRP